MNKNFIKIAFRNFIRNKTYSLINIIGLGIGIACTVLIISWIKYEVSFDRYHQYNDRIYRIQREPFCSLAPSFAPLMKQDFPEIEKLARITGGDNALRMKYKESSFVEKKIYFAEADIFEIFSLDMIYGDGKTALTQPYSIVLTEDMAYKYFGKDNPLGKVILIEDTILLNVTGIIKNIPANSHFHFDFLVSYLTLKNIFGHWGDDYYFGSHNFNDNICFTYTRLAKGTNPLKVEAKIPKFIDRYIGVYKDEDDKEHLSNANEKIKIMKVADIHLFSHTMNELETNGDIKYITIFSLVAFFILLIACINFINLSIAKSLRRAKEVALRKVLGSSQRSIISELIIESTCYILMSLFIAIILYETVSPYFNSLWNGWVSKNLLVDKTNLLVLLGILIFSGITAGLYPAIFISRFNPNEVLKNGAQTISNHSSKTERSLLRKSLTILQFSISISIMIGIGIIYKQLKFIQSSDLGFDKENVILIPADQAILNKWSDFKQELLTKTGIKQVTKSKRAPTGRLLDNAGFEIIINGKLLKNPISMPHNRVEPDFFKTYGIKIIAGRDFDINILTDFQESAILNETAVKKLGFKNNLEAVGKIIKIYGNRTIIGISQDFHYESFHYKICPIVTYITDESNTIAIKINPGNIQERIKAIESVWNEFHKGIPLNYSFLDEKINFQYQNELRMLKLFNFFGLLAVLISCLGLFGLAAYSTERRTKEIGIRKSNGATTFNILIMLSKDFTKLVVIAFIIVCPIGYYLMNKWLQNFAYKTTMSWWIFALAGFIAFIIALATVSWQAWKAANKNPVEALRYE